MPLSERDVALLHQAILGRAPRADEAGATEDGAALVGALLEAPEFLPRAVALAARHFVVGPRLGLAPGDVEILHGLAPDPGAEAEEGFVVGALGLRTRVGFFRGGAWNRLVLGAPIPGDFHAEALEWVALAKALEPSRARGRLRVAELGAGWGPWTAAAHAWGRRAGVTDIRLHAVEADPGLFGWLGLHLADNGVPPEAAVLHHAAIGAEAGEALWPARGAGWEDAPDYGARPLPDGEAGAPDYRGHRFGAAQRVPMVALSDLLGWEEKWDFVHMDLQGLEGRLCAAAMPSLRERVRHVLVATHSKALDAECFALFNAAGWECVNEFAPLLRQNPHAPTEEALTWQDGAQFWRNPALMAAEAVG